MFRGRFDLLRQFSGSAICGYLWYDFFSSYLTPLSGGESPLVVRSRHVCTSNFSGLDVLEVVG